MDQYMQKCRRDLRAGGDTVEQAIAFAGDGACLYTEREHLKDAQPRRQRHPSASVSCACSRNSSYGTTYERFLEVPSGKRPIFIRQRQRKRSAIIVGTTALLFLGMILWVLYCL